MNKLAYRHADQSLFRMISSICQALQQLANAVIIWMFGRKHANVLPGSVGLSDVSVNCCQRPDGVKIGGVFVADRPQ